MNLEVLPLHRHPQYLMQCCDLINDEWKRSQTARLRSLETSCETLPANLILVQDNKRVVGHCKLTVIPRMNDACYVESVVIDKSFRGQGYGKHLMTNAEIYCKERLNLKTMYLSTKGQEGFYSKLGYTECLPVSIYGSYNKPFKKVDGGQKKKSGIGIVTNAPPPPPLPHNLNYCGSPKKIYMAKYL